MQSLKFLVSLIKRNMIILILTILIIINLIFLYYNNNQQKISSKLKPRYHFYVVAPNSVDPFWREVRLGVEDAAKDYNVVVEFNAPKFNNPQEELKYLDMAVISNVDGIITHVSNGLDFTSLINEAYNRGIPVVTIENDDKKSNRNAFVGTTSFLLGKEAAKLMIKATKGKANIAIIVSNDYELDTVSQNLKINGFLSAIKNYAEMKVVKIYTSKMGILSAEEITETILNDEQNINAIYTTSSVDTLGTAQQIVNQNEVGNITLVGYGDSESILRYIRKGIIYGTVMSDPYKMGYESLKALIDIEENNNVSTFIDTGVKVLTTYTLYEESLQNRKEINKDE
ncbi:substrate-binding domain-containing protein [Thermohalobacter berrensis]|uniref:Sugar ABC transporter substrate-binding protein n=1 Tax=Thermohalobacter berrensis TaxID=99594 RepID=A0A419T6E4_9FIRM|nr:substrate-binding domain-containing protein [Thermohalobacter berrensis]RKD33177.1 sugar ABC transporter substrate-binding protein [Thermohalobacter berrensis]